MTISNAAQKEIDNALQGCLPLTTSQDMLIRDSLEDRGYAFCKASLSGHLAPANFFDGEAQMTLASFVKDVLPAVKKRAMSGELATRGSDFTAGAKRVRVLRQMYPVMLLGERMESTAPVGFMSAGGGLSLRMPSGYGVSNAGASLKGFLGIMYADPADPRSEVINHWSADAIGDAWTAMLHWVIDDLACSIEEAVAPVREQIRSKLVSRAVIRESKATSA